jgi:hypothetical protein
MLGDLTFERRQRGVDLSLKFHRHEDRHGEPKSAFIDDCGIACNVAIVLKAT